MNGILRSSRRALALIVGACNPYKECEPSNPCDLEVLREVHDELAEEIKAMPLA